MDAFTRLDAKSAPLPLANIDTDQIIPKQFLKTVEREGLGKGLFYEWRFDEQGREGWGEASAAPLMTGETLGSIAASTEYLVQRLLDQSVAQAKALVGAMDELTLGDPWALATDIGPVIDTEAQSGIRDYIAAARADGVARR